MIYTFCTNIFIKNTNLWFGQRRAGQLVIYNIQSSLDNLDLKGNDNKFNLCNFQVIETRL